MKTRLLKKLMAFFFTVDSPNVNIKALHKMNDTSKVAFFLWELLNWLNRALALF